MLYIQKYDEPDFLSKFKKDNPKKNYDCKEFAPYRVPLNDVLRKEQKGLCAYCCSRIKKGESHNEHIEPRNPSDYASDKSLDYYNIVASCNREQSCGKYKKNKYSVKDFVSPTDVDCESKFEYNLDGIMDGDDYTIDLLNLNSYDLQNARRSVIKTLQSLNGDKELIRTIFMDEDSEELQPYFDVIKWYYKSLG